jgi:hypothetical protein
MAYSIPRRYGARRPVRTSVGKMGQPVAVLEGPAGKLGMVRFEANRSFTGMGHERFASPEEAVGTKPAAVVAQRLFATGQVAAVHVYGNIITVDLAKGCGAQGLEQVVRDLYQYWRPGMEPPAFEDLVPEEESAAPASTGASGEGDVALSAAAKRVPAHLFERSKAARARLGK